MKKIILLSVTILFILFSGCAGDDSFISYEEQSGEESEYADVAINDGSDIYVAILGCVEKPGVYILKEGSRLFEGINAAGGVTTDADLSSVNLVETLSDGETVTIRALLGSNEYESLKEVDDGLININKASLNELCEIPGIGKTRAQAIVDYREKSGEFSKIEDIMKVNGIKEGTFEKIKEYIKVR